MNKGLITQFSPTFSLILMYILSDQNFEFNPTYCKTGETANYFKVLKLWRILLKLQMFNYIVQEVDVVNIDIWVNSTKIFDHSNVSFKWIRTDTNYYSISIHWTWVKKVHIVVWRSVLSVQKCNVVDCSNNYRHICRHSYIVQSYYKTIKRKKS